MADLTFRWLFQQSERGLRLLARARGLTGLENPNSPIQLKDWLTTHGCEMSSLAKTEVEDAITTRQGNRAPTRR